MPRHFRDDLVNSEHFTITLELVPGPESQGRSVDTIKALADDARKDGRVSAVSITDNPGGNPSLSPDVLGSEIQHSGMDVLVHCTCRDTNRAGLESRALQLSRMGLKNILALTGDYSGHGFGGVGKPVFDLDSATLICFLRELKSRMKGDGFFLGCAVSPFKWTEAEAYAQYAKLKLKHAMGANFVITQLGYDARKFLELLQMERRMNMAAPTLGTVFLLTPGAARAMHQGRVPGAVVTDALLERVTGAQDTRDAAIESAARLAVVLKGLGYRGIHIGGIHKSFGTVDDILDRMERLQDNWRDFVPEFDYPYADQFYVFDGESETLTPRTNRCGMMEHGYVRLLHKIHDLFFDFESPLAGACQKTAAVLDRSRLGRSATMLAEDIAKTTLFACERCGDCGLQHLEFLCPESQCPKHMRNGACGGSDAERCEVHPEKDCVWVRCYKRLAAAGQADRLNRQCVPPRLWELDGTPSWLNFHLRRDHQSLPCSIAKQFGIEDCPNSKPEA